MQAHTSITDGHKQLSFEQLPSKVLHLISQGLPPTELGRFTQLNQTTYALRKIKAVADRIHAGERQAALRVWGFTLEELNRHLAMSTAELYPLLAKMNPRQQATIIKHRAIEREALWLVLPKIILMNLTASAVAMAAMYAFTFTLPKSDYLPTFRLFVTAAAAGAGPLHLDKVWDKKNPHRQLIFSPKNPVPTRSALRECFGTLIQLSLLIGSLYSFIKNGFADTMQMGLVGFGLLIVASSLYNLSKALGFGALGALPTAVSRNAYFDWRTIREAQTVARPDCCARLFSSIRATTQPNAEHQNAP
jgi:hypothetical protein